MHNADEKSIYNFSQETFRQEVTDNNQAVSNLYHNSRQTYEWT